MNGSSYANMGVRPLPRRSRTWAPFVTLWRQYCTNKLSGLVKLIHRSWFKAALFSLQRRPKCEALWLTCLDASGRTEEWVSWARRTLVGPCLVWDAKNHSFSNINSSTFFMNIISSVSFMLLFPSPLFSLAYGVLWLWSLFVLLQCLHEHM